MYKFNELERNLMIDLKVVSKIRDNERVLTKNKNICIDSSDRLQFFRRWLNGENREDNISRILSIFNQSFDIVFNEKDEFKRRYFVEEIRKARKGIASIQITYRDDSNICSQLDLLIDRIDKTIGYYTANSFP